MTFEEKIVNDEKKNKKEIKVDPADLFTDREEPQEAFERKYKVIARYRKKASCVLHYYGIGGIGKSTLKNRLEHILNGDLTDEQQNLLRLNWDDASRPDNIQNGIYAEIDFEDEMLGAGATRTMILLHLRNQLAKKNPSFQFVLFDAAMVFYWECAGKEGECKEERPSFLSKYSFLNSAVTFLGAVPDVGFFSNIIQGFDGLISQLVYEIKDKNIKDKYRAEWNNVQKDSRYSKQLQDHLLEYFITDMYHNMTCIADRPLVIFVDTYEKYIDSKIYEIADAIRDDWVWYGENSLIQGIPGIMWVFFGRERLTWDNGKDPLWKSNIQFEENKKLSENEKNQLANELLEQHRLGDLSERDTKNYLNLAGIYDEELIKEIFNLTIGTPIFLKFCVNIYNNISQQRPVEISDFGENRDDIINRYLKYVRPRIKHVIYILSIVWDWDDALIHNIKPKFPERYFFTVEEYEDVKKRSFILPKENNYYHMHNTVRTVCFESVKKENSDLMNITNEILRNHYAASKNDETNCEMNICKYAASIDDNNFFENTKIACANAGQLLTEGDCYGFHGAMTVIYDNIYKHKDLDFFPKVEFYVRIICAYANAECGYIKESLKLIDNAEDKYNSIGFSDEEFCQIGSCIGIVYSESGEFEIALKIGREVYEKRKEILGDNHPDTISALNNLGNAYSNLGQYEKALETDEEVYEKRKEILGDNHPNTIASLHSLGNDNYNLGIYKKALAIYKEVYKKLIKILGKNHPDAISVLKDIEDANSALKKHH